MKVFVLISEYADDKFDPNSYERIEGIRSTYELARILQADVDLHKSNVRSTEIVEYEVDEGV